MRVMTFEQAREWCVARGIVADSPELVTLKFNNGSTKCLEFQLPAEATRAMALAYTLLMTMILDDHESKFQGALLWIRQWGIWSETTERVGLKIVEMMRLAIGESRSLQDTSAHLFDKHELVEAHAFIMQPLFFQWDAFFVPSSGKYFATIDHDGELYVASQDQLTNQALLHRFQDWHPKPCDNSPSLSVR